MYTLLIFIVAMLVLPASALGKTIYFQHDAETPPIGGGDKATTWGFVQRLVTRSTDVAKTGQWSLRHEVDTSISNQTGKVVRWFSYLPEGGLTIAYYSAWFYIQEGFEDANGKNIFQWKSHNTGTIDGGFKASAGPLVINGVKQLRLHIEECQVPKGTFSQYIQFEDKACTFLQRSPKPVPMRTWFHIEAYYKASDKNGHVIFWQDGEEIFNLSHPDLNTLTRFNKDSGQPNQWSDNKYVIWGIGAYAVPWSDPPFHLLYTDDALVTDYPVHQNPSIDTIPPSPPTGLIILE